VKGEEIAYRLRLLQQNTVIFAERHAKDDAGVNLETMDPLFPLRALSAEVEHMYPVESIESLIRIVGLNSKGGKN
jgi:hypothetical protein